MGIQGSGCIADIPSLEENVPTIKFKQMKNQFINANIKIYSEEHSKAVQEVLFKLGYTWSARSTEFVDTEGLSIITTDNGRIYYGGDDEEKSYDKINIDDLYKMLSEKTESVKVELSNEYTAEIQQDGSVKVGCQDFSFSKIKELYKAAKKVRNQKD